MNRYCLLLTAMAWLLCSSYLTAQRSRDCDSRSSQTTRTGAASPSNVALVIGNANYANDKLRLGTPVEDACAISRILSDLGYQVTFRENTTSQQLRDVVKEFGNSLKIAAVGVFYYAGHAAQVNGANYLVPIDGDMSALDELKSTSVKFDSVVSAFRVGSTTTNVAILDACRNNPLPHAAGETWVPGLAPPSNAPVNALFAFATAPDNVTDDGKVGKHSPYTRALLKYMKSPGLPVEDMFKLVRSSVQENTDGGQVPWENSSLKHPFFFREPVYLSAQILGADDDALLIVNGEEVLSWNSDGSAARKIPLKLGSNEITLKIYNQHTFTGGVEGLGGHLPEGWNYRVKLILPDNNTYDLQDGEDRPVKDGPHHGKMFTVARIEVSLDSDTDSVRVLKLDKDVWKHDGGRGNNAVLTPISAVLAPAGGTPDWQKHIDWCIQNYTTDPGETNCASEYLGVAPECILGGGRACLLRKAISVAKTGNCSSANSIVLLCQCHNPGARQSLVEVGERSVCAYLSKK